MKLMPHIRSTKYLRASFAAAAIVILSVTLAACGGGSSAKPTATSAVSPTSVTANPTATANQGAGSSQVLPVSANPITNTSTVRALTIKSVLVENNVDAAGKDVSDHLEIALTNTGTTELGGFEIYYTFFDSTTNITENYYAKLPTSFTIPSGGSRIAHFDNTGETDHFPVNDFSLYYTSVNALDVTVTVSATDAAIQTTTVKKDAGGAEAAD